MENDGSIIADSSVGLQFEADTGIPQYQAAIYLENLVVPIPRPVLHIGGHAFDGDRTTGRINPQCLGERLGVSASSPAGEAGMSIPLAEFITMSTHRIELRLALACRRLKHWRGNVQTFVANDRARPLRSFAMMPTYKKSPRNLHCLGEHCTKSHSSRQFVRLHQSPARYSRELH